MKTSEVVFSALVICAVLAVPILGGRLLTAWAENTAAVALAEGQADALRITAQSQADTLAAYTAVGVRAIESDRHAAHGPGYWQVAALVALVVVVAALVAALWWQLRLTRQQLRAVVAARLPEAPPEVAQ